MLSGRSCTVPTIYCIVLVYCFIVEPATCNLDVAAQCLSVYAVPTIFANVMTLEDKKTYCDE